MTAALYAFPTESRRNLVYIERKIKNRVCAVAMTGIKNVTCDIVSNRPFFALTAEFFYMETEDDK